MSVFSFRTRGMVNPRGKPRVYLCCHPGDFGFADDICSEILEACDCAFWLAQPHAERSDAFLDMLSDMQLFVMPVTQQLLTQSSYALEREFAYARSHGIPVLPLMQEPGLTFLFNKICGELQCLDKHIRDLTAVSYKEKLRKFLEEVLLDDETRNRVRSAFDARYFLSYRKKDRTQARGLMRLIHRNQLLRDVAVWYDEFLVPGEDYNDTIRDAIRESELFVLAVTPSVLEPSVSDTGEPQENYVVRCEYPYARELSKPILPLEMTVTDSAALREKFRELPACTDPTDPAALSEAMVRCLPTTALGRNQGTAEHDFLIGLAYLHGIDMETDHEKAVSLIRSAAEAGLPEAVETMVKLCGRGMGVDRDLVQMQHWQNRLILLQTERFTAAPTRELGLGLLENLQAQLQLYDLAGDDQNYMACMSLLLNIATALTQPDPCPEALRYLAAGYLSSGNRMLHAGSFDDALQAYTFGEKELSCALALKGIDPNAGELPSAATEDPVIMALLQDYCTCLCGIGDATLFLTQQGIYPWKKAEAYRCFQRVYTLLESPVMKNNYPAYRSQQSVIFDRMGTFASECGDLKEAKQWYRKALDLDIQRVLEVKQEGDLEVFDSCARSMYALATIDPGKPDTFLLLCAKRIWEDLSRLVPEFPEYRERAGDLEVYLKECYDFYAKNPEQYITIGGADYKLPPIPDRDKMRLNMQVGRESKAVGAIRALVSAREKKETPPVSAESRTEPASTPASAVTAPAKTVPAPAPAAPPPAARPTEAELKTQKEKADFRTAYSKAQNGDAAACLQLATCCLEGTGTARNKDTALEWAEKAHQGIYDPYCNVAPSPGTHRIPAFVPDAQGWVWCPQESSHLEALEDHGRFLFFSEPQTARIPLLAESAALTHQSIPPHSPGNAVVFSVGASHPAAESSCPPADFVL